MRNVIAIALTFLGACGEAFVRPLPDREVRLGVSLGALVVRFGAVTTRIELRDGAIPSRWTEFAGEYAGSHLAAAGMPIRLIVDGDDAASWWPTIEIVVEAFVSRQSAPVMLYVRNRGDDLWIGQLHRRIPPHAQNPFISTGGARTMYLEVRARDESQFETILASGLRGGGRSSPEVRAFSDDQLADLHAAVVADCAGRKAYDNKFGILSLAPDRTDGGPSVTLGHMRRLLAHLLGDRPPCLGKSSVDVFGWR